MFPLHVCLCFLCLVKAVHTEQSVLWSGCSLLNSCVVSGKNKLSHKKGDGTWLTTAWSRVSFLRLWFHFSKSHFFFFCLCFVFLPFSLVLLLSSRNWRSVSVLIGGSWFLWSSPSWLPWRWPCICPTAKSCHTTVAWCSRSRAADLPSPEDPTVIVSLHIKITKHHLIVILRSSVSTVVIFEDLI